MEPPPFGDGNFIRQPAGRQLRAPSMEPPPFGDGNHPLARHLPVGADPSMEPPPFGDGNMRAVADELEGDSLQWSHRPSAMETRKGRPHTGSFPTFNGATALRRWKLSMPSYRRAHRFNLQWSHRPSAMETHKNLPQGRPPVHPSMEPPPFGDGNYYGVGQDLSRLFHLQWSHRPSAMETSSSPATGIRTTVLQWSHRPSAMETWTVATNQQFHTALQWSHRPSAMETIVAQLVAHAILRPSMEPPPFGDGNYSARRRLESTPGPSMEPPPFGDGNYP